MVESTIKKLVLGILVFSFLASIVTQNGVIFTTTLTCLIIITPFGVAWYIEKASEIRRLQEKIRNYKPGGWTIKDAGNDFVGPPKIKLGVYGIQGSGKSALLNSLHFAFKDEWQYIYAEGNTRNAIGGETMYRDPAKLTDYITTFDTRGLIDLSDSRVDDVMAEISGKRGMDARSKQEGEEIDCPIFVYQNSPFIDINNCRDFLLSFSAKIKASHGAYPIMVITFADYKADRDPILGVIISSRMDDRSLFFIENYTAKNHEMNKEKHIALLKILEACILRADDNITYKWRKERDRRNQPSLWSRFLLKIRFK